MNSSKNGCYQFGPFLLDAKERLVLHDGQEITLTPKAFETLVLLVENSGHALTKEAMLAKLWPDTFVEEANLTNNISILRRALGDDSEGPRYIQTLPKVGYRFVAAVNQVRPHNIQDKRVTFSIKRSPIFLTATIAAALALLIGGIWLVRKGNSRAAVTSFGFRAAG